MATLHMSLPAGAPLYGPPDEADKDVVPHEYLVAFKKDNVKFEHEMREIEELFEKHRRSKKTELALVLIKFERKEHLPFCGFSAKMDKEMLEEVGSRTSVKYVEKDMYGSLESIEETVDSWGLNRIQVKEHNTWLTRGDNPYKYTYDEGCGEGVTVYVLDSGVAKRPEFEPHEQIRFLPDDIYKQFGNPDFLSDTVHGTGVAGIISSKTFGVSKKATIFSVNVCYKVQIHNGTTQIQKPKAAKLLSGLRAAVNHHCQLQGDTHERKTSVVNMSLSVAVRSENSNFKTELKNQVEEAERRGMVVVAAAGNQGIDARHRTPACIDRCITVAASDINDKFWTHCRDRNKKSNYGQCVDIIAPGGEITTIQNHGFHGTSAACPHVSGVLANILSRDPYLNLNPQQLKDRLLRHHVKHQQIEKVRRGTKNKLLYYIP